VWTVDEPAVMQQLFAAAVNAVITNNFELAQQVRAAM
jgi:glycerophosphoryl diester phosphodiesterase